jgi:putative transposase
MYVHLVWATYLRIPMITPERERDVYRLVHYQAANRKCTVIAIGGLEDHIHVLVKLSAIVSVAELVQRMKCYSSTNLSRQGETDAFKWQDGYSATTLQTSAVQKVKQYVHNQKTRHALNTTWPALEED